MDIVGLVRELEQFIETSFSAIPAGWVYFLTFCSLSLGILALPLPDEFMMLLLGYLTLTEKIAIIPIFACAFLGSLTGVSLGFLIGRRYGYPVLVRHGPKFFITHQRLRLARMKFRKHGNWLLLIGYFLPGIRHLTAYMSGISGSSYRNFAAYAYTGAFLWCTTFIGLGRYLGGKFIIIAEYLQNYSMFVLLLLILLIVAWISWRWILSPQRQK
ncbi:DedA family protein [Pasteuria penetrans]|uniref:DedA family protein n=1 Tax=Pasteuria penetrans TaxID=86005 RepID=UPI000F912564|nr:DedA family protein [Pasteuria penetrans]